MEIEDNNIQINDFSDYNEKIKRNDSKTERLLCIASLIFMFVFPTVMDISCRIFMTDNITGTNKVIVGILGTIHSVLYITAWVLAVVARVKYKGTFSLVLLIIYGIFLVVGIIGIIAFIILLCYLASTGF